MFQSPIRSRVMKIFNARLLAAEKQYQEQCDAIDKDAFQKKADVADQLAMHLVGSVTTQ